MQIHITKRLIYPLLSIIILAIPVRIVAYFASFFVSKQLNNNRQNDCSILVSDPFRFREDLMILRENTGITFIDFSVSLQDKISAISYYSSRKCNVIDNKINYLARFIPLFLRYTGTQGFISAGMYYMRNYEWEKAATQCGIPFFCLHREGVGETKEGLLNSFTQQVSDSKRRFYGKRLMVATDTVRQVLLDRNYITDDEVIITTGLPRFDKILVDQSGVNDKSLGDQSSVNNKILLFSFLPTVGLRELTLVGSVYSGGYCRLFDSVHGTLAKLAIELDVQVIIKPKWYKGEWKSLIDKSVFDYTGNKVEDIENLSVVDDIGAQELIKDAGIVVAFNSTTMIESILYNKRVVFPVYHEAADELKDYVFYQKNRDSFFVAHSEDELIDIVIKFLNGELQPPDIDMDFIKEVSGPQDHKNCLRIEQQILSDVFNKT